MNRDEANILAEQLFDRVRDLNTRKGNDYAGHSDALANFKRIAAITGLTPFQVWGVFTAKHWDAICTYLRDGGVQSEPITGRIDDMVTYLTLLDALIHEQETA